MRILVFLTFLTIVTGTLRAQTVDSSANGSGASGSQDSAATGALRPRWGSYLIQTFPTPAASTSDLHIQFYNHRDETLMCRLYDAADRLIAVLWPKQLTPQGLHQIDVNKMPYLETGMYFIRLTTFTASDAEDVVDNGRFIIQH
jgi:hypothetical protein